MRLAVLSLRKTPDERRWSFQPRVYAVVLKVLPLVRGYYASIDPAKLVERLARRVSDPEIEPKSLPADPLRRVLCVGTIGEAWTRPSTGFRLAARCIDWHLPRHRSATRSSSGPPWLQRSGSRTRPSCPTR